MLMSDISSFHRGRWIATIFLFVCGALFLFGYPAQADSTGNVCVIRFSNGRNMSWIVQGACTDVSNCPKIKDAAALCKGGEANGCGQVAEVSCEPKTDNVCIIKFSNGGNQSRIVRGPCSAQSDCPKLADAALLCEGGKTNGCGEGNTTEVTCEPIPTASPNKCIITFTNGSASSQIVQGPCSDKSDCPKVSEVESLCTGGPTKGCGKDADVTCGPVTPAAPAASDSTPSVSGNTLYNPLGNVDSVQALIGKAIRAVLGIVGALALLMFVYGGIVWVTSGGNEKRIEQGKNILINATIGLLIIFFSYTFINLFFGAISSSTDTIVPAATTSQNNS
ncbi:MAG TPA: pilin [Patescibacteria group bacterium]|nr:pilin [Patescibacteria group bacterium]